MKRYWGRAAYLFIVAGAVYGGGVVGVEYFTDSDVNSPHYNMWTALEEGMEMFGVIILIYAVLDHMRTDTGAPVGVELGAELRTDSAAQRLDA